MTHFDQLALHIPDLASRRILDIGSGKGGFLIDAALYGATVVGVELYDAYRATTQARAAEHKVVVEQHAGVAEELPLPDGSFGFFNMGEVIEHVESPEAAMREAYRVLQPGGVGYVSVPNRFGFKDQHFHLYFANWMPRAWSDTYIGLWGRHKTYDKTAGRQRLSEMHYYTWGAAAALMRNTGFEVVDVREIKLRAKFPHLSWLLLPLYRVLRFGYFDSFHMLLHKP